MPDVPLPARRSAAAETEIRAIRLFRVMPGRPVGGTSQGGIFP